MRDGVFDVRGMDIGKQWSASKNATLIIDSYDYINGTVTSGSVPVFAAIVNANGANTITGGYGNYSLKLSEGIYTVNASRLNENGLNASSLPDFSEYHKIGHCVIYYPFLQINKK